jgi:hypothetical protein
VRTPRPTYANVVSSLALFIALGGTSYAVTQLPRNSVGSRQLKANAVSSGKIRNGAVERSDLAASALTTARGPRGASGPAGDPGAAGVAGPPGLVGPSETIQVKRTAGVQFAPGAGTGLTHATVTLAPGSWLLDAQVKIFYPDGTAYFDCDLKTAAGDNLVRSTLRVGNGPSGTTAGTIPLHVAASFAAATQVLFTCIHPEGPLPGSPPLADQVVLTATRIGSLQDR